MIALTTLLAGCKPEAEIAIRCPGLDNPPPAIVAAMERAGRGDEKSRQYVIKLAKHYEKLGVCNRI